MGLLDDAIRDHLELKRRRGADPGEVAREQHEALEPVLAAEPQATPDPAADASEEVLESASAVGEETQELDMESVLAREAGAEQAPATAASGQPPGGAGWADELVDDPEVPREIPGQERLSFE